MVCMSLCDDSVAQFNRWPEKRSLWCLASDPAEPWTLAKFAMHKLHIVAAATSRQPNGSDRGGHGYLREHSVMDGDRAQE